jgi:hypothetical protein
MPGSQTKADRRLLATATCLPCCSQRRQVTSYSNEDENEVKAGRAGGVARLSTACLIVRPSQTIPIRREFDEKDTPKAI